MAHKSKTKSSRSIPVETVSPSTRNLWPWIALGVVLLATAIIRIRLLMIPLERDEGEFAYMGQLMLQGIPPYKLAYNMKLPGTYAAYALIMSLFGQTIAGIHIGLLLVNLTSTVMVFLLAKRILNPSAAVVAAASFALLSLSPTVNGTSAHATQFVLPFALGGCLLLLKLRETGRPVTALWSGLMFGIALLMKQHAAFFPVFAALYLVYVQMSMRPVAWKRMKAQVVLLAVGTTMPFLITCLALYASGVFHTFWFWTFTYARAYVSQVSMSDGVSMFWGVFQGIMSAGFGLWVMAGLGLITTVGALFLGKTQRANTVFLLGFALFSFLCVCPGYFFRNHYFVLIMPAVGFMIGVLVMYCEEGLGRVAGPIVGFAVPIVIFAIMSINSANVQRDFFFRANPEQACRMMYSINPFPESVKIGKYIKEHSTKTDKIAVIGSEPQIYFYANRHSATGFIYTYGLMEEHKYALKMQKDMIAEISNSKPRYVVITNIPWSWAVHPKADMTIMQWASIYLSSYYNLIGRSDAVEDGYATMYWGDDVQTHPATSDFSTYVMERKPGI